MRFLLLLLFCLPLYAFSTPTRDQKISLCDVHIQAPEPLRLYRTYHTSNGWKVAPHTHLLINFHIPRIGKIQYLSATVSEPNGDLFEYLPDTDNPHLFLIDFSKVKDNTNTAQGKISGRTNLKNQRLLLNENGRMTLETADGIKRHYSQVNKQGQQLYFLLESEVLASGNRVFYQYDKYNRLTHVRTTSSDGMREYASATVHHNSSDHFSISTSDGKTLSYLFSSGNLILEGKEIEPSIKIDPNFEDALLEWSADGELLALQTEHSRREFIYDSRGNVIEERLIGDLTGHGQSECFSIFRTYNEENLLTSYREGNGETATLDYLPGTDLLTEKRLESGLLELNEYDEDRLLIRQTIQYPGRICVVREVTQFGAIETFSEDELLTREENGILYDAEGNQLQLSKKSTLPKPSRVNARGQPLEIPHSNGEKEEFFYRLDGAISCHIGTDGKRVEFSCDSYGLPHSSKTYSPEGELIDEKSWEYQLDRAGFFLPTSEPASQFDLLGRRCRVKSGTLFTHVTWNEHGYPALASLQTDRGQIVQQKRFETDADGMVLASTIPSDDGDGTTQFHYDLEGDLIQLTDPFGNVHAPAQPKKVDQKKLPTEEIFENGYRLHFTYDEFGRKTSTTLPDGSSILYRWGAQGIQEITRLTASKKIAYKHLCLVRNSASLPSRQRLIEGMGELMLRSDKGGEISEMRYGDVALSVKSRKANGEIASTVNGSKEETIPQEYTKKNPTSYTLSYDSLGRIEKIHTAQMQLLFTYDHLNRRMTKVVFELVEGKWKETLNLAFLYDGEVEIGAMDRTLDTLKQLKVTAPELINTGDDAIAYEIDGRVYLPIYDLWGNVYQLHSLLRRSLIESYHYSAFGEEKIFDSWNDRCSNSKVKNPWRFQCARCDDEVGLIYLNGRYFDPNQKKFLTGPHEQGFVYCRKLKELEIPAIFFERAVNAASLFQKITDPEIH